MKLYLSGPMRNQPRFGYEEFAQAAQQLREQGYEVLSPVEMDEADGVDFTTTASVEATAHMTPNGAIDEEYYLTRDEAAVKQCDGIALLDGWYGSTGAKRELRCAILNGLKVYTVVGWLEQSLFSNSDTAEVRQTDASTGAQKGGKLARYDLIPPEALQALAEVYGRGAKKYAERNWEAGYPWGWSFAACMRHLWSFWSGKDRDAESGQYHLAHAAWHCFTMLTYLIRKAGTDDRAKGRS